MKNVRLVPEEKVITPIKSDRTSRSSSSFSFIEQDAAKGYHGLQISYLDYLGVSEKRVIEEW